MKKPGTAGQKRVALLESILLPSLPALGILKFWEKITQNLCIPLPHASLETSLPREGKQNEGELQCGTHCMVCGRTCASSRLPKRLETFEKSIWTCGQINVQSLSFNCRPPRAELSSGHKHASRLGREQLPRMNPLHKKKSQGKNVIFSENQWNNFFRFAEIMKAPAMIGNICRRITVPTVQ